MATPEEEELERIRYWQSRSITERMNETWRLSVEQAKKVGIWEEGRSVKDGPFKLLTREEWIKSEEESYKRFMGLE